MKFAALCDWATFRKIFNKYCLDKPHLHRSRTDVILIAEPTGSGGSSMKTVIIYGSCYGTSERYARELARQTGAELHAAKDLRDLTGCGLAVHIGGLYAGGLAGLRQTLRLLPPDCWLMADGCHSGAGGHCPSRECAQYPGLAGPADPAGCAGTHPVLPPPGRHPLRQAEPAPPDDDGHAPADPAPPPGCVPHRGGPSAAGNLRQGSGFYRPLCPGAHCGCDPLPQASKNIKNRDPVWDLCFSVLWDYSSRTRTVQVALTPEAGFSP